MDLGVTSRENSKTIQSDQTLPSENKFTVFYSLMQETKKDILGGTLFKIILICDLNVL